jgi:uncharacterized damage-inducible protein DinB
MTLRISLIWCLSAAAFAQGSNPISADVKQTYAGIKDLVLRSAEKMPEEHYAFQPTPEVRTFAGLLAHIADAQYLLCSTAKAEKWEGARVEKKKTTKSELIPALKEAFGYCDSAYDSLTDTSALEIMKLFGRERPRIGILNSNVSHTFEHYGNLVTYMRMKGLVPPSSEPRK